MSWDHVEKIVKSIMDNSFYLLILLLMILLSSYLLPSSTRMAFENFGELLPEFLMNYFNNLSLTNNDILSIFILLSTLHIFSLLLLLLSCWKMNYYKETHALFSFFWTINTYFVLLISILYTLDVTTFNFFDMKAGFFTSLIPFSSFYLVLIYIFIVLIGFVKSSD